MKTRYSKTTSAFYPLDIDYQNLPPDIQLVALSDFESAMARPTGYSFSFDASGVLSIAPPAPPSFSEVKTSKISQINQKAEAVASQLTAGYPDFETQTWPDQKKEALAWEAGGGNVSTNTVVTPYIDSLATYRGIDRLTYLGKTIIKVKAFDKNAKYLTGTRQKYVDGVYAIVVSATTTEAQAIDQVKAIDPAFTLLQ